MSYKVIYIEDFKGVDQSGSRSDCFNLPKKGNIYTVVKDTGSFFYINELSDLYMFDKNKFSNISDCNKGNKCVNNIIKELSLVQ